MKKILLPLLSLISVGAFAQISIDSSNIAHANNFVIQQTDTAAMGTLNFTTLSTSGANVTWDFTTLVTTGVDTAYLQDKSTGYGNSNFPNATYAINSPTDTASLYIRKSNTELTQEGTFSITNGNTTIDKLSSQMISFPSTYNTTFTHNSTDTLFGNYGGYSVRIIRHLHQNSNIDGWGKAHMPNGYFNVIRQNVSAREIDSTQALIGGLWTDITQTDTTKYTYRWWTDNSNVKYALVEMPYDSANSTMGEVDWIDAQGTNGIKENKMAATNVTAYPNPANNQITFTTQENANYNLVITTVSGKKVAQVDFNENQYTFDLTKLPAGVYFYHLTNGKTQQTSNGKFIKTK